MKKIITALAIVFATLAQAQPTNGLVAKYSFSGNANDEVGSNNGTVHGATLTTDRFGTPNKAYKFTDGEYITLPDAAALKSTTMTVSLWVKIDGYNAGPNPENFIYTINNSKTNAYFATFGMLVSSSSGKYFSVAQNNPSESQYGQSANEHDSTWQHYVLAMTDDSLKMWIDGKLEWSKYKGFTSTFTNDSIYIGTSGNTTYYGNFNGSVDDIRVYNRMLNNTDVDSLFNEAKPSNTAITYLPNPTSRIQVFPNPTSGIIHISERCFVTLMNCSGKTVMQKQITNALDISPLANGIYYLQMEDGEQIHNCKIIKTN